MKKLLVALLILSGPGCTKTKSIADKTPDPPKTKCGTILVTPTLDSFVYPTFYVTTVVAFPDGDQMVHFSGDVTGDHDSSWYLPRYDKDSSFCITVP